MVDIHTHTNWQSDVKQILNAYPNEPLDLNATDYSCGIHPWFAEQHTVDNLEIIEERIINQKIKAIGECGLDKVCSTPFDQQLAFFNMQIELAVKHQMPIMIHCVKAYQEVFGVLKMNTVKSPVIFHAYGGNAHLIQQLSQFDAYFSFGESLMKQNRKEREIIKAVPLERLFLETDMSQHSIRDIYSFACELLKMDFETLESILLANYKAVFGNG